MAQLIRGQEERRADAAAFGFHFNVMGRLVQQEGADVVYGTVAQLD